MGRHAIWPHPFIATAPSIRPCLGEDVLYEAASGHIHVVLVSDLDELA